MDLLLVVVSELNDVLVAESSQVVGLNDGLEDGESVLNVSEVVEPVDVNTGDFDFISGSGNIDEVMHDNDLFLSWYTSSGNRTWGLLDSQLLEVAVESPELVRLTRSAGSLANDTRSEVLLAIVDVLNEDGSLDISALTFVVGFMELRLDT